MPDLNAYTVWCAGGKIGTYHTREAAEKKLRAIAMHPLQYLHIQEWAPGAEYYDYVTFEDDEQDNK
jgi:hypothetical protein